LDDLGYPYFTKPLDDHPKLGSWNMGWSFKIGVLKYITVQVHPGSWDKGMGQVQILVFRAREWRVLSRKIRLQFQFEAPSIIQYVAPDALLLLWLFLSMRFYACVCPDPFFSVADVHPSWLAYPLMISHVLFAKCQFIVGKLNPFFLIQLLKLLFMISWLLFKDPLVQQESHCYIVETSRRYKWCTLWIPLVTSIIMWLFMEITISKNR